MNAILNVYTDLDFSSIELTAELYNTAGPVYMITASVPGFAQPSTKLVATLRKLADDIEKTALTQP